MLGAIPLVIDNELQKISKEKKKKEEGQLGQNNKTLNIILSLIEYLFAFRGNSMLEYLEKEQIFKSSHFG